MPEYLQRARAWWSDLVTPESAGEAEVARMLASNPITYRPPENLSAAEPEFFRVTREAVTPWIFGGLGTVLAVAIGLVVLHALVMRR